MRTASDEAQRLIGEGKAIFYQKANITFTDGRRLDLDRDDFYIDGQTFSDSAGTSEFPLGEAVGKAISLSLVNDDERFDDYDFMLAKVNVICCLDLPSGITERWQFGIFTVTEPETYGDCVVLTAINDMYKGNKPYSSNRTFPLTIGEMLRDSCYECGVTLQTTTFPNDDYRVSEVPADMTHRELWGRIAMIAGGNAVMDDFNRLSIKPWEFFSKDGWVDGGKFDIYKPYKTGDSLDGGDFSFTSGDRADGGRFGDRRNLHIFNHAFDLTASTDDVIITGVVANVGEETYTYGDEGYMLVIENPLIEGNPQDAVNRIGAAITGGIFRPVELSYSPYPFVEFGDPFVCSDWKGNTYCGVVTDYEFTYHGQTTIKCSAQNPLRNSSQYNSADTKAQQAAKKEVDRGLNAYDKAIQALTNLMTYSFGVFKTEEKLEDGSVIYYLHDKPELKNSKNVWKMTAEGFAVSTDGGKTWNAGFDAQGNAVVNVLSAIGINFDWARGGTLTLGGLNNQNGKLTILNADNYVISEMDNNGLELFSKTKDFALIRIHGYGNNTTDVDGDAIRIYGKGSTAVESARLVMYPENEQIYPILFVNGEGENRLIQLDATSIVLRGSNSVRVNGPVEINDTANFSFNKYGSIIEDMAPMFTPKSKKLWVNYNESGRSLAIYTVDNEGKTTYVGRVPLTYP